MRVKVRRIVLHGKGHEMEYSNIREMCGRMNEAG